MAFENLIKAVVLTGHYGLDKIVIQNIYLFRNQKAMRC